MPPKRTRKPVSCAEREKKPRLMGDENAGVSQLQELERALEQNDNHSRVLHLIREVAKLPNLAPNLTTRLLKFCVKVDSEYVLRLLLENQAVDLNTRQGGELLWAAVEKGQVEIAAMLVRRGANLSVRKFNDNSTVLQGVLRSYEIKNDAKGEELARLMLDHGADVNARDSQGYSVLHDAIIKDRCSSELVEELLRRGAEVSDDDSTHLNDLFWASCYKPELLLRLIEHQVPDEETRNKRGAMAIDFLISKDSTGTRLAAAVRMIKRILDLGVPADTDVPEEGTRRGVRSILATALFLKKKDVVKLLLDHGAAPRRKDERGHTLLFGATAFKGYTHATRWLIEKGASIHDRNDDGCYPIHGACLHDSVKNIHLLLNLGADLNVTDNTGRTPFVCTDDPFKFNETHALIIKHFALMIARGMKISDEDMECANRYVWGNHHFKKCREQLERMKVEYICDGVSYFTLLSKNMSYSVIQITKKQNLVESFKKNFKKWTASFPDYSYMLLQSFEVAEKRLEMLVTEKEKLREAFPEAVPDHIVENIAYYFCYEKLERCQHDYYMFLHANLKNTQADKEKIL